MREFINEDGVMIDKIKKEIDPPRSIEIKTLG